jgi:hypothetical protein
MNCQSILQDEIAEKYLRGKLDPAKQDEFEVHILECGACLQSVEVLQEMREALHERAHEIRVASPARLSRVWYWAFAAASLAVVIGVSALQWRHLSGNATEARTVRLESPAQEAHGVPPPTTEPVAQTKEPEQTPAVSSRHNAIMAKNPPAVPKTVAQEKAPEPPKGAENSAQTAVAAPPASETAAGGKSAPVLARKQQPELTQEQAVELYKLGEIRPAPYSFAGLAGDAKLDRHAGNGAVAGGAAGGAGRSAFSDAMVAYVDGHYAKAASLLELAATREPKAPDINFYRGVCSLLLGHPDETLPALTEVVQEGKSPLVQPAHIYLARAYLQKVKLKEAEAELEAASALPGPRKQEATTLLERVRALRASIESAQANQLQ